MESASGWSLVGIKPDALELEEQIKQRLEDKGFEIHETRTVEIKPEDVLRQYGHVREKENGRDILSGICEYLSGEKIKVAIVSYDGKLDVYSALEETVGGNPHPQKCSENTIRGETWHDEESPFYAYENRELFDVTDSEGRDPDNGVRNRVHFSDSPEEFINDVSRYFPEKSKYLLARSLTN